MCLTYRSRRSKFTHVKNLPSIALASLLAAVATPVCVFRRDCAMTHTGQQLLVAVMKNTWAFEIVDVIRVDGWFMRGLEYHYLSSIHWLAASPRPSNPEGCWGPPDNCDENLSSVHPDRSSGCLLGGRSQLWTKRMRVDDSRWASRATSEFCSCHFLICLTPRALSSLRPDQ